MTKDNSERVCLPRAAACAMWSADSSSKTTNAWRYCRDTSAVHSCPAHMFSPICWIHARFSDTILDYEPLRQDSLIPPCLSAQRWRDKLAPIHSPERRRSKQWSRIFMPGWTPQKHHLHDPWMICAMVSYRYSCHGGTARECLMHRNTLNPQDLIPRPVDTTPSRLCHSSALVS